ncbi:MAG: PBP1A family penicillin-binding protein [Deltaproteobacteria bacterium]|nr:PBP1A family penicillin-binding protein [Deltaproteobacteria bacterium]
MRYLKKPLHKIIAAAAVVFLAAGGFYLYLIKDLPSITALEDYHPNLVTKVYSDDGRVIGEFYTEKRTVTPLNNIPAHLVQAFLAAEDTKFFEHGGIDYLGIARALYKNITAGRIVQGGSTITQQVARTFFLTSERKLTRKLREAILAYRIEKHLSKDEILYLYLNQIYFGDGAYGVQAASESYFGKNVNDLSIAEAALLAGLPKAPTRYSPYANFTLAKKRQEFIIGRMLEEGFITNGQAADAYGAKLELVPKRAESLWAGPFFTEHIRRYVEEKYGDDLLYKGGLEIYTTMNVEVQKAANRAIDEGLRAYDKRRGYRGAVERLKGQDAIEDYLKEADRQLSYDPVRADRIYRAVVTSADTGERAVNVRIGHRGGVISYPDLQWARVYNPEDTPDGGKFTNPLGVFAAGDIIEVKVKTLPPDEKTPIPCALEQTPLVEGSLLAMEPETGHVKAMVGGHDFSKTQFNRAVQAKRQPGSAFKPIIYATAIDSGYTPSTIVMDSPIVFAGADDEGEESDWKPKNFEEKFNGPTTIRNAIVKSRNVVTIKVLKDIGVNNAISYARKLGIESPLSSDLSLALGSSSVSLTEMVRAFATFGNEGVRPEMTFVTKIADKDGTVLEENAPKGEVVLSPQTAYIMTSLLQGVVSDGTGWRAKALGRPVAGKTGTTNNLNDAWFIGYVRGLASGVWVGYDNEQPLGRHETGAAAALPVWVDFMKQATSGAPMENFPVPEGVEFVRIDPVTGLPATTATNGAIFEAFKAGTAPKGAGENKKASGGEDFFRMDAGKNTNDGGPKEKPREKENPPEAF